MFDIFLSRNTFSHDYHMVAVYITKTPQYIYDAVISLNNSNGAAAVAQWVGALAPQAGDWVFESQLQQT